MVIYRVNFNLKAERFQFLRSTTAHRFRFSYSTNCETKVRDFILELAIFLKRTPFWSSRLLGILGRAPHWPPESLHGFVTASIYCVLIQTLNFKLWYDRLNGARCFATVSCNFTVWAFVWYQAVHAWSGICCQFHSAFASHEENDKPVRRGAVLSFLFRPV